jgi:hypothetical protein
MPSWRIEIAEAMFCCFGGRAEWSLLTSRGTALQNAVFERVPTRDYTRVCKRRTRMPEDILARNESWAARLEWKTRASENIMEHITNTRADPQALRTQSGGGGVDFACFSLFRCQLGIMAARSPNTTRKRAPKVNMLENYLGDYARGRRRQRRLCQRD